jgi:trehalose 6-phosphate synthase
MYDVRENKQFDVDRSGNSKIATAFEDRELVVVSNRQPYRHTESEDGTTSVDRPTGGLTASLDPTMQQIGGTWIAWGDGDADSAHVDENDHVAVPPEDPSYTLRRVWLDDEQIQQYYYGFSNRVLWPLCHSSLATIQSEESYWEQYRQTNEQFAAVIGEEATEESVVWLQDYHFGLAAGYIRDRLGTAPTLMQFWHIPWPSADVYRACPHGRQLLEGLLGNDVIGFHAGRYCHNFLECVDAEFDDLSINWRTGTISDGDRTTHVKSMPLGVPFDEIEETASDFPESEYTEFKQSRGIDADTKIAVSVERLDYSKGIPERLRALELFWERNPEWQGSLTHVLNHSESRSQIPAYERLQERVSDGIERVNERFGTEDWQPVMEIDAYLSQRELYGLYRHSDLCLVTPICDGLNLVAAEYAAAQINNDGVLVLSDQAGIHGLLGESAVSVSPYNPGQIADCIKEALSMPAPARESQMKQLRQTVAENDLDSWIEKNVTMADRLISEHGVTSSRQNSRV